MGRPGVDRLHRRHPHRRRPRPQRPAPVALLRHQGRPGHHGVRGRRARHPAGADPAEGPPAAGPHVPGRHRRRAGSSPTTRSSSEIATAAAVRRSGSRRTWSRSATCPSPPSVHRARSRDGAAAAAGVRLHQRGPEGAGGADGGRRRRGRRLDGQRHAAGRALGPAAAALQLLQAALRAGDQPAGRLHPRRDHHVDGDDDRPRGQPARADAASRPGRSSCRSPILRNEELEKLRSLDGNDAPHGFKAITLPILFHGRRRAAPGLRAAIERAVPRRPARRSPTATTSSSCPTAAIDARARADPGAAGGRRRCIIT